MDRRPPGVAGKDVEPERTSEMGNDGLGHRIYDRRRVSHGSVRGGDHQEVNALSGGGEVVIATERTLDVPASGGERTAQREPGPTRTDDA